MIFCYRNLRPMYKNTVMWSVKSTTTGLVVARKQFVVIKNAKLKVSLAGNARVRKEKRKNVHAGIQGTWVRGSWNEHLHDDRGAGPEWVRLDYNPYKHTTFVRKDTGEAVYEAKYVILDRDGAWAFEPR